VLRDEHDGDAGVGDWRSDAGERTWRIAAGGGRACLSDGRATTGYGTAATSLLTTGIAGTDSIGGYV